MIVGSIVTTTTITTTTAARDPLNDNTSHLAQHLPTSYLQNTRQPHTLLDTPAPAQMHKHRASTSTTMDLVSLDGRSKSSRPPSETDGSGKAEEGGAASDAVRGRRRSQMGEPQTPAFRERAGEAALRPLEGWRLGGVTTA